MMQTPKIGVSAVRHPMFTVRVQRPDFAAAAVPVVVPASTPRGGHTESGVLRRVARPGWIYLLNRQRRSAGVDPHAPIVVRSRRGP